MSSPPLTNPADPPYYILVSHVPLLDDPSAPKRAATSYNHPAIEYHYADDLPHNLLPRSPGEHVLVLDYDPSSGTLNPTAQSLSTGLAVIGVKATDAPGASATEEDGSRNKKMYVLETTTFPDERISEEEYESPDSLLARLKQRNAVMRRVLDYPNHVPQENTIMGSNLLTASPTPMFFSPPTA